MTASSRTSPLRLLLLLLTGAVFAEAQRDGWISAPEPALANETVQLTFQLQPEDAGRLTQAFYETADPAHASFRAYLSSAEVAALVKPKPGAEAALQDWWREHHPTAGLWSRSTHGDLLYLSARVSEVESAFGARMARFTHRNHPPSQHGLIRTLDPSVALPVPLQPHVVAVLGLSDLSPPPRAVEPRRSVGKESCDFKGDIIDPHVIAKQYGIPNATRPLLVEPLAAARGYGQGVAAFEDAEFKQADVDAFDKFYGLPPVSIKVIGPNKGGFFGEASLDTQYITAAGMPGPTYYLSQEQFDLLAWCELVGNLTSIPKVLSISWGGPESQYPKESQLAADRCFQKLGLQGVSILAASGDQGTGKQGGEVFRRCQKFDPTYPASSPYLTSVGATYLQSGSESGWSSSGGGFSAVFDVPPYQNATVQGYLASAPRLPNPKLYTPTGRATPDVSALGTCYTLFSGGAMSGTLSGTSASTPTFAGMVALLNAEAASQGKPPLGFLNPALYAAGAIGFDVTQGNNKLGACPAGFPATKGWDAITGLGTPTYQALRAALL